MAVVCIVLRWHKIWLLLNYEYRILFLIVGNLIEIQSEYYYKITESDGKDPEIIYDSRSYIVKVEVADNGDGTLDVKAPVVVEGGEVVEFINKYYEVRV